MAVKKKSAKPKTAVKKKTAAKKKTSEQSGGKKLRSASGDEPSKARTKSTGEKKLPTRKKKAAASE
jgi:hypothetical protein